MNALNTKFKSVKMDWDSITFPLLQGTPIGADGTIQNDEDAIGLVMETLTEKPLLPNIDILVAGDVDASEILYTLSAAAKNALFNIWIYDSYGAARPYVEPKTYYAHLISIAGENDSGVTVACELTVIASSESEAGSLSDVKELLAGKGAVPARGTYDDNLTPLAIWVTQSYVSSEELYIRGPFQSSEGVDGVQELSVDDYFDTLTISDTVTEI